MRTELVWRQVTVRFDTAQGVTAFVGEKTIMWPSVNETENG